jgi:hypothetical protein
MFKFLILLISFPDGKLRAPLLRLADQGPNSRNYRCKDNQRELEVCSGGDSERGSF